MACRQLTPEEAEALLSVGCVIKCRYKDNTFISLVPKNWFQVIGRISKHGWSFFIEEE